MSEEMQRWVKVQIKRPSSEINYLQTEGVKESMSLNDEGPEAAKWSEKFIRLISWIKIKEKTPNYTYAFLEDLMKKNGITMMAIIERKLEINSFPLTYDRTLIRHLTWSGIGIRMEIEDGSIYRSRSLISFNLQ